MQSAPERHPTEERPVHRCAYQSRDGSPCQYEGVDRELLQFSGRSYCLFHLPRHDAHGQNSPKSEWDSLTCDAFNQTVFNMIERARITQRSVDLNGVVFPAAVSFAEFDATRPLPEISFAGARFCGTADFAATAFGGPVDFSDSVFAGEASFHHSQFKDRASFADAQFHNDAWFRHAKFRAETNFSGTNFELDAGFTGTYFGAAANFNGATFHQYAGFDDVVATSEAWFTEAKFRGFAGFVASRFQADACFRQAVFSGTAAFNNAQFHSGATFANCSFARDANFEHTQFYGTTRFERTSFGRLATFSSARFKRDIRFNQSVFRGAAELGRTKFLRDVGFADVQFAGVLNLERAIFHGHVGFDGADFGRANFDAARFYSDALFSCPTNYGQRDVEEDDSDESLPELVTFRQTKFSGRTIFANRKFSYPVMFENAEFALAPDFYGSALPTGSSFSGTRFLDRGAGNERAAWAYHTLKLIFEAQRDRATVGMFFALEQESASNTHQTWSLLRLLPTLYEMTSGNGESMVRPLVCLAVTTLLAAIVYLYLLFGLTPLHVFSLSSTVVMQTIKMSLQPIVTPLWLFGADCQGCGKAIKLVMTVQSLLSLLWLGLWILAARRHFSGAEDPSLEATEVEPEQSQP